MPKRFAYACGGTGGHIYPAIALSQYYKDNSHFFITSSKAKDKVIFERYQLRHTTIPVKGTRLIFMFRAFLESLAALRAFRPDILFGTGGYVSFPVLLAAKLLRIPIILLEQNVVPGRVTKVMHSFSAGLCLSFEQSLSYISPSQSTHVTGNPVRKSYIVEPKYQGFYDMVIPDLPVVLVFGGSQGAESLNRLFSNQYKFYLESDLILIHITGPEHYERYYKDQPFTVMRNEAYDPRVIIFPYFDDMDTLYILSSVVVSRAGATTIAELLNYQKPAVLIPYPHAKDNHQVLNAKAFCDSAQGIMIEEPDLTFEMIQFQLNRLILMAAQAVRELPDPCDAIDDCVVEVLS